MLSQEVSYNELGDLSLDKLNKHHLPRNLVRRWERLGYAVTLLTTNSFTRKLARQKFAYKITRSRY